MSSADNTPYGQARPPKTVTKIRPDTFLHWQKLHTWLMLGAAGLMIYFFRGAGLHPDQWTAYIVAGLIVGFYWIWLFRSDDMVQLRKDKLLFFIEGIAGKHLFDVAAADADEIKEIIPIVGVYDGIVEFRAPKLTFTELIKVLMGLHKRQHNEFGVLFETKPARISDEERERHEKRLEMLVNGLPVNTIFKTSACSVLSPKNAILNYFLELQDQPGDEARDLLLASLYNKIASDNTPVIAWRYFAFVSLGQHRTLKSSQVQFGAIIPGLMKNMSLCRINPRVLMTEKEVINAYRTMLGEFSL